MEDQLMRGAERWTAFERWFGLGMFMMLCACSRATVPAGDVRASSTDSGPVSLALVGYNYTDRYIDTFSVDGQGGSNLFVSSPTSGGGGSVCCATYWPGLKDYKVKVRWQSGASLPSLVSAIGRSIRQVAFVFQRG